MISDIFASFSLLYSLIQFICNHSAARGRGKSAALGLAMAAAVGFGYSNIFVTSPSPQNLGTLFDFVFKGKIDLLNNLSF